MPKPWEQYQAPTKKPWEQYAQEPQEESSIDWGESVIKPALQTTGAVLGGAAGLASPIPGGTIAGGALGYGLGSQLYDIGKTALGQRKAGTIGEETEGALKNVAEGAMAEMGGQAIGQAASKAIKALPEVGKKIAKSLYDVPANAAERIAKNPESVQAAMKDTNYTGGMRLLDNIKQTLNIKSKGLNEELEKALASKKETVNINKMIEKLDEGFNKIGQPATIEEAANKSELQKHIEMLQKYREAYGNEIPLQQANQLKRDIQKAAFKTDPSTGIKYERKDVVSDAMKNAANNIKTAIEEKAPEVKDINRQLQELIEIQKDKQFTNAFNAKNIENTMKNLSSETGNKGYLRDVVKKVDKKLGTNIEETAKDYHAAKYLRDPESGSTFKTGRSLLPGAVGGSIGALGGGWAGAGLGSLAGTAIASPQTFKAVAPRAAAIQKLLENTVSNPAVQTGIKTTPYYINNLLDEEENR